MNRREEWLADRHRFLKLVGERDPQGDLPVAIRIDLTPEQVAVMAPGVSDFDAMRAACQTFLENWLAPELKRLDAHLKFKHNESVQA